MDENLSDQQRAEQIRIWLRDNGWYLLAGLLLGVGALFGWRQWTEYNTARAEKASGLYEEMLSAIRVGRTTRAEAIAAQLAADYASTPYLDQARLAMAKAKLGESRPEEAAKYLREVVDDSGSPEIANIARLRLGRVLAQEQKYDDALKVLTEPEDSAFASQFHEVRGDVYYAMGRLDDARAEYEAALGSEQQAAGDQALIQAKLAQVSKAPAPGASTGATAAD